MQALLSDLAKGFAENLPAQLIGVVAIILYVISYQFNSKKVTLILQIFSCAVFSIHFFMLGGIAAAIANLVAIFSCIIFIFRNDKKWADNILWPIFFIVVNTVMTACNSKEGWRMAVSMTAFVFSRMGLFSRTETKMRLIGLPAASLALTYNILVGSYAGIVAEVFSLTSLTIAVIRFDILKRDDPKAKQAQ